MHNFESPQYRRPHFTPDEINYGSAAIRWVTAGGVCGRPTHHDVREYVERTPQMDCMCQECRAFYVGGSKRLDSWRDLCLRYDGQRMLFRDLLKCVIGDAEAMSASDMLQLRADIEEALQNPPPLPAITKLDAEERRELEELRREKGIMVALREAP